MIGESKGNFGLDIITIEKRKKKFTKFKINFKANNFTSINFTDIFLFAFWVQQNYFVDRSNLSNIVPKLYVYWHKH